MGNTPPFKVFGAVITQAEKLGLLKNPVEEFKTKVAESTNQLMT